VIFDQIGTPTFADDLARLILQVIDGDMLDRQGIYNYSNEGVCSWYDFAMEICALSGHKCDISPCHTDEYPRKARRPHFSVLDKTGVKKSFGIRIPHWKESLASCISMMMNE
jgi:dTDP-4-dehydrorhamnose reductase